MILDSESANDPAGAARLFLALHDAAVARAVGGGAPGLMDVACVAAGAVAEVGLSTDRPDLAVQGTLTALSRALGCAPAEGAVPPGVLPVAPAVDAATEGGREAAREFWAQGPECEHAFEGLLVDALSGAVVAWEDGAALPRARALRVLAELSWRALGFEFAAQELCDAVIEGRLVTGRWGPGECITALAAAAGRRQALGLGGAYVGGAGAGSPVVSYGMPVPGELDAIAHVMTREAVRGGVEAGSDWRFGLAANDMPLSAPVELIRGVEPVCQGFFRAVAMPSWREQAVACAKAAGRMLAVAAGGNLPDIEPAIAKPLAMAALTETYRYTSCSRASMSG